MDALLIILNHNLLRKYSVLIFLGGALTTDNINICVNNWKCMSLSGRKGIKSLKRNNSGNFLFKILYLEDLRLRNNQY